MTSRDLTSSAVASATADASASSAKVDHCCHLRVLRFGRPRTKMKSRSRYPSLRRRRHRTEAVAVVGDVEWRSLVEVVEVVSVK